VDPTNRTSTPNCACKGGYYDHGEATCGLCNYKCILCSNGTSCTTCASVRILGTGACDCPVEGYYDNGSNSECQ